MMLPAEVTVLLLVLWIIYQSISGYLKQKAFEAEIAKVWERVRTLDTDLDHIDKRVERVENRAR